jgi:hypothetical protein
MVQLELHNGSLMLVTEPINLREWKAPAGTERHGRLFTCGRPGRATHGRAKVAVSDATIDLWERGLPAAVVLHVVSLLGQKTTGLSEFSYYPFRSTEEAGTKPPFEKWMNERYGRRFVVHEFPTVDGQGIPPDLLQAAGRRVLDCLERGHTTLVIDSAGAERTARVCEAIGYKRIS